ncbi:hypothetical protein OS493_034516 [Desmophyllum pertusum]|uniref:EFHB C-terminal EF-hand domain-containing protein n=1 Tax=Desmophyllum pertusum TaxID=174260 RepID=A0A9W9YIM0_9CNID|nr:hypothetical protein OS493_034516 [Desmophyllum pertusum]
MKTAEEEVKEEGRRQASQHPQDLKKQIDQAVGGWKNGRFYRHLIQDEWPTLKNYGDESDAYGLINPSLYSNCGVYEKDFFQPRDQYEIRRIFDGIGVEMTSNAFEKIWEQASTRHPNGLVSVESFRGIMDEVNAQKLVETQVS